MRDLAKILTDARPIPIGLVSLKDARARYAAFRGLRGAAPIPAPLLTHPSHNVKFAKTAAPVFGLALAQADASGAYNACRASTPECRRGCVSYAGKGELASVQAGRARKTVFLATQPEAFLTLLTDEIRRASTRLGDIRVRLNTFSDLPWETIAPDLFASFPRVAFYDYTKWNDRGPLPANYRLTYSASEKTSDAEISRRVRRGENVAVVFAVKPRQALPTEWRGLPVIDADKSDDRWSDPRGVVVGLRAKGRMRSGSWAMVREIGQ
jgi:hypothetical protein